VFLVDDEFRVLYVNRAFCRAHGVPETEVVGRPLGEVFSRDVAEDPTFLSVIERARAGDRAVSARGIRHLCPAGGGKTVSLQVVVTDDESGSGEKRFLVVVDDEPIGAQFLELSEARLRELAAFDELARSLPGTNTRSGISKRMLGTLLKITPAKVAACVLLHGSTAEMTVLGAGPVSDGALAELQRTTAERLSSQVSEPVEIGKATCVPNHREVAAGNGFEGPVVSVISQPVVLGEETLGLLALASDERGAFAAEHTSILSTIANEAALGLQQLAYYGSLQRAVGDARAANEQMMRLCQLTEGLETMLDESEVLELVLRIALQELSAQEASVLLLSDDGKRIEVAASAGHSDDVIARHVADREDSAARWVIENSAPLILTGKATDGRFRSVLEGASVKHSLVMPMKTRGRVVGTLNINRLAEPYRFTDSQVNATAIIANQTGAALENIRLFGESMQTERLAIIGQAVAGMAHYVKNISNMISNSAQLVDTFVESKDWERLRRAWGILRRNTDALAILALDMLDLSRSSNPICEPTDMNALVLDVVLTVEERAKHFGVSITFELDDDVGLTCCDKGQITRCLLNLITNAFEAMPSGGELRITTHRLTGVVDEDASPAARETEASPLGDHVEIRVADTGPGIEPENIAKLFLPLFTTKGSRGTGIGLAVTKKILEEHGGTVLVESEQGQGAVFTIQLPIGELGSADGFDD